VSKKANNRRGVATLEYGIAIGAVAIVAAAMFAQTSAGIKGVWKHAAVTTSQSPAAQIATTSPQFIDCMAKAHGDSKICSSAGF
jgi:Flp pilus assembly pilin Flp